MLIIAVVSGWVGTYMIIIIGSSNGSMEWGCWGTFSRGPDDPVLTKIKMAARGFKVKNMA